MYLGNILVALNDFVSESNPHVKRIHISHDDLDGYGCTFIIKKAGKLVNNTNPTPVTYINISQPSMIETVIENCVHAAINQGFDAEHDVLSFLITDIGNVNPAIFRKINDDMHVTCSYIIVDHHVRKYDARDDEFDQIITPDRKIALTRGYYFVYNNLCATYILFDAFTRIFKTFDDTGAHTYVTTITPRWESPKSVVSPRLTEAVKELSQCVNDYDTGNWGNWNCSYEDCSDSVKLQLIFNAYKQDGNDFSEILLDLFNHMDDMTSRLKELMSIAKLNHNELIAYHQKFLDGLKHCDCASMRLPVGNISIKCGMSIYYYIIENESDELGGFFSLLSKEVLENTYPECDMLVLVDLPNNAVSLRSKENGINCARIAMANGGGGHPRTAGFPLKKHYV